MGEVRRSPLNGHTLFIETAEPRAMALEVLCEVEQQLDEADRLKGEAVDLLQRTPPSARWSASAAASAPGNTPRNRS